MSSVADCLVTLPRAIKIGAYDWAVVLEPGNGDLYGQACFDIRQIKLWPEALNNASHTAGIVLHECLHVIFDNHNLGRNMRKADEREEMIVLGFEAGLVSLFRDNPKLVSWLKKSLK